MANIGTAERAPGPHSHSTLTGVLIQTTTNKKPTESLRIDQRLLDRIPTIMQRIDIIHLRNLGMPNEEVHVAVCPSLQTRNITTLLSATAKG
jgi:hypothetical protein